MKILQICSNFLNINSQLWQLFCCSVLFIMIHWTTSIMYSSSLKVFLWKHRKQYFHFASKSSNLYFESLATDLYFIRNLQSIFDKFPKSCSMLLVVLPCVRSVNWNQEWPSTRPRHTGHCLTTNKPGSSHNWWIFSIRDEDVGILFYPHFVVFSLKI